MVGMLHVLCIGEGFEPLFGRWRGVGSLDPTASVSTNAECAVSVVLCSQKVQMAK
jgi:hypothetical protein